MSEPEPPASAAPPSEPAPDDAPRRFSVDNYAIADGPRLGVRGWLRWMWRQVTSMRLALVLLLLLGLAAIPGSMLPQWPHGAPAAQAFLDRNGAWGRVLNALGFLDVFGSAWFTAIYVLLFASLIGCIIPRAFTYARALRAPVTRAPRTLRRYQAVRAHVDGVPADLAQRIGHELRPHPGPWGALTGYRVRVDATGDGLALSAEKGHVRELGNLVFHLALVGVLVAFALGGMLTYRGQALIVEGGTFTNAVVDYDTYSAGRLFNPARLEPFTVHLDSLDSEFYDDGRPAMFSANITLTEPRGQAQAKEIQVNRPLQVAGGKMFLMGNGFAPDVTVTDATGAVAFSGPVPFLVQDAVYTSTGVIKVPDVSSGEQLGFSGVFLPTAVDTPYAGTVSVWPEPTNPVLLLTAYRGDLGLDGGVPQNVYTLDMTHLSPVRGEDGQPFPIRLTPGQSVELPDGLGTVTWNALPRYIAVDLRADPTLPWLLGTALAALGGLALSLFGVRRRVWVLLTPVGVGEVPRTLVEGATLAPPHDHAAPAELARALAAAGVGADAGAEAAELDERPHTSESR